MTTCDTCSATYDIGDWPWCPHGRYGGSVESDSIPGGLTIHNMGHEPVTVYSWSERKKIMKQRGLREQVRHVGLPGTDKSQHTTRWT